MRINKNHKHNYTYYTFEGLALFRNLIGKQLTGTRLGILGMGRIGQKIAKIAKSLGMIIHYHNRSKLKDDKENGAMKVISGSHKKGVNGFKHHTNNASHLVLDQEVSEDQIEKDKIVYMDLKAGEISLHNDALLHGSDPNNSNRKRCGITMRFSPTNVKGDLNEWPFFETQLARGEDTFKLNPIAQIPRGEATPIKRFCFSKDFENEW